jgi:predicted transcriptional regulator
MAATTTIRLPPKLRMRLASLAKQTDRSAHSIIVEAVERYVACQERLQSLVKEALEADAGIERSAEIYGAEDVHAWLENLARTAAAPRPRSWRK